MDVGLVAGVVALGVVHGVLPDHGWPIAATYALERPRKWISGTLAALVLGVGHLISSVVLVVAYFWFATFAAFAEGPWLKPLAGAVLVLLGAYEFLTRGHHHGLHDGDDEHHDHDHDSPDEQTHTRDSDDHHDGDHTPADGHHHDSSEEADSGRFAGVRKRLSGHSHGHGHLEEHHAEEGLRTLGITALVLGFAHEEPIQILAICAGTEFCLELMFLYSFAVIIAILAPTLLLIAGYRSHRDRIERYTPYLPTITAAVLVGVGLAFIVGIF